MIRAKKVYLNRENIGEAHSWNEVFALLSEKAIAQDSIQYRSEGPDGFYLFHPLSRPDLLAFGKSVTG